MYTEEGFRSQFRSAKPDTSGDMPTFFARLKRYFSRWVELAGVEQDFHKLVDLVLREQLLIVIVFWSFGYFLERRTI